MEIEDDRYLKKHTELNIDAIWDFTWTITLKSSSTEHSRAYELEIVINSDVVDETEFDLIFDDDIIDKSGKTLRS